MVGVWWFWFRRRAVLGVSLRGCTPLTPCGGRWLVGVTRCGGCGSCGAGSGWAGWPGMAGVCPWGFPSLGPVPWCGGVPWGPLLSRVWCTPRWQCGGFRVVEWLALTRCAGVGRCWSRRLPRLAAGASPFCGCLPRFLSLCPAPFPALWPLPFPPASVGAPCVVVLWCSRRPFSRGCIPLTLRLSLPLCRGPSLCPLLAGCPGGGVVVGPGGRRWPMLGGGGGLEPPAEGFGGVGGVEALNHVPEERCPCALWHGGL